MSENKRSVPMMLLRLAKSGYEPLNGTGISDTGLPYFAKHKLTGKVICLRHGNMDYRPMGKLVRINFK